jgi:putative PIN family toxin of toxin-antitoxin system
LASKEIRAVIDTNVLFEGVTRRENSPGVIIDAWLDRIFRACVSNALAYEYLDVLSRKLSNKNWIEMEPVLAILLDMAEFVPIKFSWRPISPDPNDDHVIDCAMNANAIIVTSNTKDFKIAENNSGWLSNHRLSLRIGSSINTKEVKVNYGQINASIT